jgi:site-specific DNA recombinase
MLLVPAAEAAKTAVVYARVSTKEQAERDGDPEGYSIPAQREACRRKAESLGASVIEVFVDRGESARSADRGELQKMLRYLAAEPVSYVIVHKIDRLARNRSDDVAITAAIAASGATLVSVTENIDETPSGLLLHGIMSSIAEFYSRNLAAEVIKGTQQKVQAGGTPTRAPIGYRNIRKLVDGYETRTVELDDERAPLVRWAFRAYATGEWSLSSLAAELERNGLSFRAGPKTASRPVPANKLHEILRNRYYLGYVTWRGVEHEGKHRPLVDAETFEQVQRTLADHRTAGERAYRREHYLVGSVRCGRCRAKLLYTVAKGRGGREYGYFYCASRLDGGNCGQRYLPEHLVEQAVEDQWQLEVVPQEDLAGIRDDLADDLARHERLATSAIEGMTTRVHTIKRERFKWAEKAMAGAVPDDIAAEKQRQLAAQLLSAESQLSRQARLTDVHRRALDTVVDLIENAGRTYARVDGAIKRSLNQAWFDCLYVDEDGETIHVVDAGRTELTEALQAAVSARTGNLSREPGSQDDYRVTAQVRGSNVACLVEVRGLEPLAPALRTQCSTGLSYTPWRGPEANTAAIVDRLRQVSR